MDIEPRLENVLKRLSAYARQCLGDQLVGLYLHGSAAMGCFSWQTGDIDCLAVVKDRLTERTKVNFIDACLKLQANCPPKGLEISVVTCAVCQDPQRDIPFELHFSPLYAESYKMDPLAQLRRMPETDPDLIAHFAMVRSRGRTLLGMPAERLFAPLPREWMLESLENDLEDAIKEAEKRPAYYVLNYCRALAFLEENILLSKAEGGAWGLEHLPQACAPLLKDALEAYESGKTLSATKGDIASFIQEMGQRWQRERTRKTPESIRSSDG